MNNANASKVAHSVSFQGRIQDLACTKTDAEAVANILIALGSRTTFVVECPDAVVSSRHDSSMRRTSASPVAYPTPDAALRNTLQFLPSEADELIVQSRRILGDK